MRFFRRGTRNRQKLTGIIASIQHFRSGLTEALFGAEVFRENRPDAPDHPRWRDFGQVEASEKLYIATEQDDAPQAQEPARGLRD